MQTFGSKKKKIILLISTFGEFNPFSFKVIIFLEFVTETNLDMPTVKGQKSVKIMIMGL